MAKKENRTISAKEFTSVSNEATQSIKTASRSIFYWVNQLNKLARKNEYCDNVPVAQVAKELKNYMVRNNLVFSGAFDVCVFAKDYAGKSCIARPYTKELSKGFRGHQLNVGANNMHTELVPVTLTLVGVFNAFKSIVKNDLKASESAEKARIANEKKNARLAKIARKELCKKLEEGKITPFEFESEIAKYRK